VLSDLDNNPGLHEIECEVLVVGAGTVGLVVAVGLAELGRNVVVVESGGLQQIGDVHELNEVVQTGAVYSGATEGRFRCLGGTSTRWGGALIPFAEADCRADEWPIDPAEVFRFVPSIEALFRLSPGPYDAEEVFDATRSTFRTRLAKWPPFRYRNVATLFAGKLRELPRLHVWLNATATQFDVGAGLLKTVTARSRNGGQLRIAAREVVIAAGAIETTRILLLMDQQNAHALFSKDGQLGRFFSDHLSVAVGDLETFDRDTLNMLAGFRFEPNGSMRNIRFELSRDTPLRDSIPPCFAHIAATAEDSGGFNAVRELYRQLQRGRLPGPQVFLKLAASTPWLARALWWRFVRRRLLYPAEANLEVHMVIEQVPRSDSRIRLSESRVDPFGQPLAEISWDVGSRDRENLGKAVEAFANAWSASALAPIARFECRPTERVNRDLARGGGIFHPVGSARIADSAVHGVVDKSLRPFGLRNVSVVSTAVLPRSGGANPTMMLLCLGMRCVASLDQDLAAPARVSN
jgi:choline dehydrogenase-like flavoprotein